MKRGWAICRRCIGSVHPAAHLRSAVRWISLAGPAALTVNSGGTAGQGNSVSLGLGSGCWALGTGGRAADAHALPVWSQRPLLFTSLTDLS